MYCFRIVNSDGSLLTGGYNDIASAQVDSPPTISNISLNGGNSITLIVGTTTTITATAKDPEHLLVKAGWFGDVHDGQSCLCALHNGCRGTLLVGIDIGVFGGIEDDRERFRILSVGCIAFDRDGDGA